MGRLVLSSGIVFCVFITSAFVIRALYIPTKTMSSGKLFRDKLSETRLKPHFFAVKKYVELKNIAEWRAADGKTFPEKMLRHDLIQKQKKPSFEGGRR